MSGNGDVPGDADAGDLTRRLLGVDGRGAQESGSDEERRAMTQRTQPRTYFQCISVSPCSMWT